FRFSRKRLGSVYLASLADWPAVGSEYDGESIGGRRIGQSTILANIFAFCQLFRFSRKRLCAVYLASLADWPVVGVEFDGESIGGKRIGQSSILANIFAFCQLFRFSRKRLGSVY